MEANSEFLPEDAEFGALTWRLVSRRPSMVVEGLPIMGLGVYLRTNGGEPMLVKNTLMIEVLERQSAGIVDAGNQPVGVKMKPVHRDLMTVDEARTRFGKKLNVYAGAVLTQERRPVEAP